MKILKKKLENIFSIYIIPLFSLIAWVEKLQWAPAPFQSPGTGFGSSVTTTPNSSATRCNKKRAIHK